MSAQDRAVKEITRLSRVEPGKVRAVEHVESRPVILVQLENPNSPSSSGQPDALVRCVYLNPFGHDGSGSAASGALPSPGTRCLVLLETLESEEGAYYLGGLTDPYTRNVTPVVSTPGSLFWKSAGENGYHFSPGDDGSTIFAGGSAIKLNKSSFIFRNASSSASMLLESRKFALNSSPLTIVADDNSTRVSSKGSISLSSTSGAIVARADRGKFDFSGGQLESYSEMNKVVTGQMLAAAGIYKLRVTNGAAYLTPPDKTTWETFVVMGDAKTIAGDGSVITSLYDALLNAKYRVEIGQLSSSPTTSFIEMDKSDIKLYSNGLASPTFEARANTGGLGLTMSSLKLETTQLKLALKAASQDAFSLEAGISDSAWIHGVGGTEMASITQKASGDAEHTVKNSIKMTVSPTVGLDMATLEMKMMEIVLKMLAGGELTINNGYVHAKPDLIAGSGPPLAGPAAFPANLSLRLHGHLTLLGPTITKIPSDVIPI